MTIMMMTVGYSKFNCRNQHLDNLILMKFYNKRLLYEVKQVNVNYYFNLRFTVII